MLKHTQICESKRKESYVLSYKNKLSYSVYVNVDDIGYHCWSCRKIALTNEGNENSRLLSLRLKTWNGTWMVRKFERERKMLKETTCGVAFKLRAEGENDKRRHSGSIGGPSIEKYFSKRLSKLFAHLVRRPKYFSIELIIDKIASAKKSLGESEEGKRLKYEVLIVDAHGNAIELKSTKSFLLRPAIKAFVARRLAMIS